MKYGYLHTKTLSPPNPIIGYGHDAITGEADLKAPFFAMAGILKVQYPIENKRDFNNLLPIIKKTYKCNFGEF